MLKFSSATAFNLDQLTILLFGKELKTHKNDWKDFNFFETDRYR